MKSSETERAQQQQKKADGQKLSKKHLVQLLEGRKIKAAKVYIAQLRNSNPRAEKYIRQVLQEIFCQRKVTSATAYMYALVFYKNLLVSGELDYYEDNEFFPLKIHQAVSQICEYNQKQQRTNEKGRDYFSYCVKIQNSSNVGEDLQGTGIAVVIYAMELLQSMAEWYKENYFTGEESHFVKRYKQCLSKGIQFPKKQAYVYIKEQDAKEFSANYLQLFEGQGQGQQQNNINTKNMDKQVTQAGQSKSTGNQKVLQSQTQNISPTITKPNTQQQPKIQKQKPKPQQIPKQQVTAIQTNSNSVKQSSPQQIKKANLNLNEPKIQPVDKPVQVKKQIKLSPGIQQILSKVQDKSKESSARTIANDKFKQAQITRSPQIKKSQTNSTQNIKSQLKNTKNSSPNDKKDPTQSPKTKQLIHNIPDVIISAPKQLKPQSQTKITQQKQQLQQKKPQIKQQVPLILEQKTQNVQKQSRISQKKSFKRTEDSVNKKTSEKSFFKTLKSQESAQIQSNLKNYTEKKQSQRHRHKIFQPINKVNTQNEQRSFAEQNQNAIKDQISLINVESNILHQNMSFSPKFSTPLVFNPKEQSQRRQKKSLPKTEKKHQDKSFFENQDLAFKLNLTQNLFTGGIKAKKSSQKFPMKTLSAWRCEKQIKKDYSPGKHAQEEILTGMICNFQLKQRVLPFVPEYFLPLTLKMSGLRRSALQIWSFTQSSQVFFNNKIIEVRLMKPSRGSYILSLLNVSRSSIKVSLYDMKNMKYSDRVKIVGSSISTGHKTSLNAGCYMDIRFMFETCDLNFKFLPFSLEIDSKILPLQLPITLLDQCIVQKGIEVDQISLYSRKSTQIIKSQQFRINKNDIPSFMQKGNEALQNQKYLLKNGIVSNENLSFMSFTLKMRLSDDQEWSCLNCWLREVNEDYGLSILFDAGCGETQNFAKVITELLTFLLYE